MAANENENELLRSVALQNARSIQIARQRAEEDLVQAKDALERKTTELAHLIAMLRGVLETALDSIITCDQTGAVLEFNPAAERMFGFNRAEAIGRDMAELIVPHRYRESHRHGMIRYRTTGEGPILNRRIEMTALRKDGAEFPIELAVTPIHTDEGPLFTAYIRDITDRKQAEGALQEQAEWLRVTLASIGDAVVTTDNEGKVLTLNAVAQSLTGWTQPEAAGRPLGEVFRIINELSRQPVENPADRALKEGRVVGLANHTVLVAKDGRETPIDDSAAPIRDQAGRVHGVVLIFRSIAERKRAEETQARLAAIVESSQDAIVSKTLEGKILSWNAGAEQLFGYTAKEAIGQPVTLLIPPDRHDEERVILGKLRRGERIEHFETTRISKDGRLIDISLTTSPIRDSSGRVIGASKIARDITVRRQIEETLRQSAAQFRQLADALPQIVWTARPDGYIDYYNERWYEFTGFPQDEHVDKSWTPILHPDDVQRTLDTYYGCIRTGIVYQIEHRFKDRTTGGYRWFLGRAYPVRDEQGRVVRWFGTCTDIDETKRNEETLRFLADASATLAELTDYTSTLQKVASLAVPHFADWCAVDMQEPDGTLRRLAVTHVDPTKVQLARELQQRYPPDPSETRGIMNVLRTGEPEWIAEIPEALLVESARDEDHLRIARELGLKSYICVPLRSRGRTLGALTFVTAESGRRYDSTDVQAATDLAHRAVIAVENATLLAALKDSDRRKDEFLAMLAHELRNPLAPIRNAAQIYRAKAPPVPELQWATDVINRQVDQMTRLVDDLLDVSRITRGKIELRKERVELSAVLNSAIEASRPIMETWGHELTVSIQPEPVYLDADFTRLAQVVLNLLNNAAKYTDHGGRIALTAQDIDGRVEIRVKDNGVGIAPKMLSRIFDMFTQEDRSLERSQGGLGIGLTLVQRLVEMHGGHTEAHSDGPGLGSEFIVRLPIEAGDAVVAEGEPESAGAATSESCRILVVDDNHDAADSIGMLLRMLGHTVQTAHDGLEAVGAAATFQPDVILLDIGLPKLNGYDAAQRIRELPNGGDIALIALTGWGQDEDRRRSEQAGFDHHMTKPVEFATIQTFLSERSQSQSRKRK